MLGLLSVFAALLAGTFGFDARSDGESLSDTGENDQNDGDPPRISAENLSEAPSGDLIDIAQELALGEGDREEILGGEGDDILVGVYADQDQASGMTELIGDVAHVLRGGEGDDSIMAGANDLAFGGSGEDTFVLDGEVGDQQVPVIGDFRANEDVIVISIASEEYELLVTWPDQPEFNGTVEVNASTDPHIYEILVNGEHVADVCSESEVSTADILVLYDSFVGPSQFEIEYGYQTRV